MHCAFADKKRVRQTAIRDLQSQTKMKGPVVEPGPRRGPSERFQREESPKSWVRIPPGPPSSTPVLGRILACFSYWGWNNAALFFAFTFGFLSVFNAHDL